MYKGDVQSDHGTFLTLYVQLNYSSPCRRLWNWFEYIFFFYNALVGIVASIFWVFLSVTINLLLLFRLDTVIFMKGFEFMDSGMCCMFHILAVILSVKATTLYNRQITVSR